MAIASLRTPLFGLIWPKGTIAAYLDPPLTATERAIVICTTPDLVTWQVMNPKIVVISSKSIRPLIWTMVFTPVSEVLPPFEVWGPLIADVFAKIQAAREAARTPIKSDDPGTTTKR